jgi:hypothetical protein
MLVCVIILLGVLLGSMWVEMFGGRGLSGGGEYGGKSVQSKCIDHESERDRDKSM